MSAIGRIRRGLALLFVEQDDEHEPVAGGAPADLRTMPYDQYLQTDHWIEQRWGALERAAWRCQVCNAPRQLHVHHRTYKRRGDELERDLVVLCGDCHTLFHQNGRLHPDDLLIEVRGTGEYGECLVCERHSERQASSGTVR